jgi:beta-glucosidase
MEGSRMPQTLPFRDPDLPLEERIGDLLGRLTLAEKVSLLHQAQPAIPRLGLAAFRTGTEALHGVAWLGEATVFPQAVGLASTWDPELIGQVGSAVGDEARGWRARDPSSTGLNLWAPVVNLLRDPRWGRNEEGYSEDPLLTGAMSVAYARGLAGDHPVYLKTAPTLKHFLAYNNEDERETTSSNLRPRVLHEYDLEAFRPAIAAGVATGVMPSYNLVNRRPSHLSPLINEVVRSWADRDLMVVSDAFAPSNIAGCQGYYPTHPEGHAAAVRAGLDSFTDQDRDSAFTIGNLHEALRQGLLDEATVDTAVQHVLSIRFRLGEFDPTDQNPYAAIGEAVIGAPAHRALARQVAREAIVLLKNDRRALPLDTGARRVAVVGPLADVPFEDWYSGTMGYQVTPARGIRSRLEPDAIVVVDEGADRIALRAAGSGRYVTAPSSPEGGVLVADAEEAGEAQTFELFDWGGGVVVLRARANSRHVSLGDGDSLVNDRRVPGGWVVKESFRLLAQPDGSHLLENVSAGRYVTVSAADGSLAARAASPAKATRFAVQVLARGVETAAAAAHDADVAIAVVGNHPMINGRETQDRRDLSLPGAQDRLVRAVLAANPDTVLVVESSYPFAATWADAHVPAIVWSSHGGQEMGNALADVLFGDYPPAGRLTQTWYRSAADLPDILDYDIVKSDRTYLYFQGTPLYPFGHGLTYTSFAYADLRLSADRVDAGGDTAVTVEVEVSNTGATAGDEVVQLYTHQRASRAKQPLRRLRGFRRVHLDPGERATVGFTLRAPDLAHWDVAQGRFVVEPGAYDVLVGRSSADVQLATTLEVAGEPIPPRALRGRDTAAVDFDDHHRVELVDETRTRGDAVAATGPGGWIEFREVDFGDGVERFTAQVAKEGGDAASIQLCLGDPATGPVIGTAPVPATGGRYTWAKATAAVYGAAGVHDLYLVFTGPLRISGFRFE